MEELLKYMKALVALQAHMIVESQPGVKLELVLANVGLNHREVAAILGKTQAAVSKTISRSR